MKKTINGIEWKKRMLSSQEWDRQNEASRATSGQEDMGKDALHVYGVLQEKNLFSSLQTVFQSRRHQDHGWKINHRQGMNVLFPSLFVILLLILFLPSCFLFVPLTSFFQRVSLSRHTHHSLTCVSVITLKRRLKGMKKGDKMESIEKQGPRQVSKVKGSRTKSKTFFIEFQWRRNTLNILAKRLSPWSRQRERERERDLPLFDEEKGVDSFQEICPALHSFVFFRKTCIAFLQPLLPFFSSQENLLSSHSLDLLLTKVITLAPSSLFIREKIFDVSSVSCIIWHRWSQVKQK